jgi:hypothetical protein
MGHLDTHAGQFIAHQAHNGLHSDSPFAYVEDDASVPFSEFDIGKRADGLADMHAAIDWLLFSIDVCGNLGHHLVPSVRGRGAAL